MENERNIYNELSCSELMISSEVPYQEYYQIRMIQENKLENFLYVTACGRDGGTQYIYDVSGMKSLQSELKRVRCNKLNIELFLKQLLEVIKEANNYMLDINCILLEPEYIFLKNGEYYFCYYPEGDTTLAKSFHQLTEYFVKEIDYGDYPSVMLACGLHKETMEESYHLQELIERHMESEAEIPALTRSSMHYERERLRKEGELWKEERSSEEKSEMSKLAYVSEDSGWEKAKGKVQSVIRETPMKRFWDQKKKEKWGTWDDLLTPEESSIIEKARK